MTEYIEREKIQELIRGWRRHNAAKYRTDYMTGWNEALEQIESNVAEDIPAAGVRPERHSHWHEYESCVFMGRYGKDREPIFQDRKTFMCVECGRNTIIKETFCPSCGAKMDGKDGENDG